MGIIKLSTAEQYKEMRMKKLISFLLVLTASYVHADLCDDIEAKQEEINSCDLDNQEIESYRSELIHLSRYTREVENRLQRCARRVGSARRPGPLLNRLERVGSRLQEWRQYERGLSSRLEQINRTIHRFENGDRTTGQFACFVMWPKNDRPPQGAFVVASNRDSAHRQAVSQIRGSWSKRDKYTTFCSVHNFTALSGTMTSQSQVQLVKPIGGNNNDQVVQEATNDHYDLGDMSNIRPKYSQNGRPENEFSDINLDDFVGE